MAGRENLDSEVNLTVGPFDVLPDNTALRLILLTSLPRRQRARGTSSFTSNSG
jgi:hypothetical protein